MTAANVNDITELAPLFNAIPPVAGKVGHPRKKPDAVQGDLAYDSEPHRQGLREMGVEPILPEKGIDDQSGLGETRWPVERTLAWSTRTGGSASAMSGGRTSIRRSSPWPASRSVRVPCSRGFC